MEESTSDQSSKLRKCGPHVKKPGPLACTRSGEIVESAATLKTQVRKGGGIWKTANRLSGELKQNLKAARNSWYLLARGAGI